MEHGRALSLQKKERLFAGFGRKVLELMSPAECWLHEQIGNGRLTNDALIAVSAGRLGIRVITTNERDFRRPAEFGTFEWQLVSI
jgi:predicted nucleic acid-binding protein